VQMYFQHEQLSESKLVLPHNLGPESLRQQKSLPDVEKTMPYWSSSSVTLAVVPFVVEYGPHHLAPSSCARSPFVLSLLLVSTT
jgi:hypothetical protein